MLPCSPVPLPKVLTKKQFWINIFPNFRYMQRCYGKIIKVIQSSHCKKILILILLKSRQEKSSGGSQKRAKDLVKKPRLKNRADSLYFLSTKQWLHPDQIKKKNKKQLSFEFTYIIFFQLIIRIFFLVIIYYWGWGIKG